MKNFEQICNFSAMAGNIIAAIATTNAIIAGLIVMEVLKMLSDRFTSCCTVWKFFVVFVFFDRFAIIRKIFQTYLNRKPNFRGRLLVGTSLCPPNPKCYVCSSKQEVVAKKISISIFERFLHFEVAVKLDTTKFTVKSLEEKVWIFWISIKILSVTKVFFTIQILKQYLHMVAPDVEIGDNKGTIIISSEEGETERKFFALLFGRINHFWSKMVFFRT